VLVTVLNQLSYHKVITTTSIPTFHSLGLSYELPPFTQSIFQFSLPFYSSSIYSPPIPKPLLFCAHGLLFSSIQPSKQKIVDCVRFLDLFGDHWRLRFRSGSTGLFGRLFRSDLGLQGGSVVFVALEGIAALWGKKKMRDKVEFA
jgi:hypothetical protein